MSARRQVTLNWTLNGFTAKRKLFISYKSGNIVVPLPDKAGELTFVSRFESGLVLAHEVGADRTMTLVFKPAGVILDPNTLLEAFDYFLREQARVYAAGKLAADEGERQVKRARVDDMVMDHFESAVAWWGTRLYDDYMQKVRSGGGALSGAAGDGGGVADAELADDERHELECLRKRLREVERREAAVAERERELSMREPRNRLQAQQVFRSLVANPSPTADHNNAGRSVYRSLAATPPPRSHSMVQPPRAPSPGASIGESWGAVEARERAVEVRERRVELQFAKRQQLVAMGSTPDRAAATFWRCGPGSVDGDVVRAVEPMTDVCVCMGHE